MGPVVGVFQVVAVLAACLPQASGFGLSTQPEEGAFHIASGKVYSGGEGLPGYTEASEGLAAFADAVYQAVIVRDLTAMDALISPTFYNFEDPAPNVIATDKAGALAFLRD